MGYRKIVKSGTTSFSVALPIQWIRDNSLKKGDTIFIDDSSQNLIISSERNTPGKKVNEITIETKNKTKNMLSTEIISLFISNYNKITILLNNEKISIDHISKILKELSYVDIIEIKEDKIVIKDYLNIEQVDLIEMLERFDNSSRAVFQKMSEFSNKIVEAQNISFIYDLQENIDAQFFLLIKILNTASSNKKVASFLKTSNKELLFYFTFVTRVYDIISTCFKIIKTVYTIPPKYLPQIKIEIEDIFNNYKRLIGIFNKRSDKYFFNILDENLEKKIMLEKMAWTTTSIPTANIFQSLLGIQNNIVSIIQIIIDLN